MAGGFLSEQSVPLVLKAGDAHPGGMAGAPLPYRPGLAAPALPIGQVFPVEGFRMRSRKFHDSKQTHRSKDQGGASSKGKAAV